MSNWTVGNQSFNIALPDSNNWTKQNGWKRYKDNNRNNNGKPSAKTETPKRGIAIIAAGTIPINALNIAVKASFDLADVVTTIVDF